MSTIRGTCQMFKLKKKNKKYPLEETKGCNKKYDEYK